VPFHDLGNENKGEREVSNFIFSLSLFFPYLCLYTWLAAAPCSFLCELHTNSTKQFMIVQNFHGGGGSG
jgi:hypothetical protein